MRTAGRARPALSYPALWAWFWLMASAGWPGISAAAQTAPAAEVLADPADKPLADEKAALERQRSQIATEIAKADEQAEATRRLDLAEAREQLAPAGLTIVAPPAPEGKELYTIQASDVKLRNALLCLARKAKIGLRVSSEVDNKTLDQPVTADLRLVSLDEAVEIFCGLVDLTCQAGRDEKGGEEVLISRIDNPDPAELQHALRRKAVDTYTKFLLKFPDDTLAVEAHFRIAEIHFDQKEYALAARDYKVLLDSDPGSKYTPDALVKLGRCYSELGDYQMASKVLYDFLDHAPGPAQACQALLAIGRAAAKAGEVKEALRAYRRLLLEFPNSGPAPQARQEMADLLYEQKEYENALQQYAALQKSAPLHEPRTVAHRAALCKMMLEQWPAAAADLAGLLASDKQDAIAADCYFKLAECLDRRGGELDAIEAYVGAITRFPANRAANAARARVVELYRLTGLIERAIAYGEESIKHADAPDAQRLIKSQLAIALLDAKLYERARTLLEELAQTEGAGLTKPEALVAAADAARKLEQFDRAEVLYRGALMAQPTKPQKRQALRGLGDTYVAHGDYEKAALAYQGLQDEEDAQ